MAELNKSKDEEFLIEIDKRSAALLKEYVVKINRSIIFARSQKIKDFLVYIVNEKIDGREAMLKEYSIALDVFGKDEFNYIKDDSVVRTSAKRLRLMLDQYYRTVGSEDFVRIVIPKGSYVPKFYDNRAAQTTSRSNLEKSDGSNIQEDKQSEVPVLHNLAETVGTAVVSEREWIKKSAIVLSVLGVLGGLLLIHSWYESGGSSRILVRYTTVQGNLSQKDFTFKNNLINNLVSLNKVDIIDPTSSAPKVLAGADFFLDVELYHGKERTSIVSRLVEGISKRIVWTHSLTIDEGNDGFQAEAVTLAQKATDAITTLKLEGAK